MHHQYLHHSRMFSYKQFTVRDCTSINPSVTYWPRLQRDLRTAQLKRYEDGRSLVSSIVLSIRSLQINSHKPFLTGTLLSHWCCPVWIQPFSRFPCNTWKLIRRQRREKPPPPATSPSSQAPRAIKTWNWMCCEGDKIWGGVFPSPLRGEWGDTVSLHRNFCDIYSRNCTFYAQWGNFAEWKINHAH